MSLYAFKLVDRNLYVDPDAPIANPFGSYIRDDGVLERKRKVFDAAMKHVEENQIVSATACRMIKSEHASSVRDMQIYRRVQIFLVMEEKEASLFRMFFPELKWEEWTQRKLDNVKKPKSNFDFAAWYTKMRGSTRNLFPGN